MKTFYLPTTYNLNTKFSLIKEKEELFNSSLDKSHTFTQHFLFTCCSAHPRTEAGEEGDVCATAGQGELGDEFGLRDGGDEHHGATAEPVQGPEVTEQHE